MGNVRLALVWMETARTGIVSTGSVSMAVFRPALTVEETVPMATVALVLTRTADIPWMLSLTGLPVVLEQAWLILTKDRMHSMIATDGLSGLDDLCWHRWMMPSAHDTVRMI